MYMRLNGMGESSNPAPTDLAIPMTFIEPPSPESLAITNEYPVVNAGTPTFGTFMTTYIDVPVIGRFTPKQMLVGAAALALLYLLLKRK